MHRNILAIDVGYGHLKAVHHPSPTVLRRITFPSFALATPTDELQKSCITKGLKVMNVVAGSSRYLVGEDIEMLTHPTDERSREESYSLSDSYLALVRGALSRASYSELDLLVVGLPLTTLDAYAERLKERLQGEHEVPEFTDQFSKQPRNSVHVKDVQVLAQPLGALFSVVASKENQNLVTARLLTLDCGYNTLDGITSVGLRPMPKRSGAVQGGVAGYIDEIQKSVEDEVRQRAPKLSRQYRVPAHLYEEAICQQAPRTVNLSVGTINLEKHLSGAQARLENDIAKVINTIGSITDIGAIVLAGGGANLMLPLLRKNYPEVARIVVANDPQFAIVTGYYLFGQTYLHDGGGRVA